MKETISTHEEKPEIFIGAASSQDVYGLREVEYQTWLNTYVNTESGITKEDIEWYFNKFKKIFSEKSLKDTMQTINNLPDEEKVIVAKDKDAVVGFAWLMSSAEKNELEELYILPEYQGQGVAKKIWIEALKFFNRNSDIVLTV